MTRPSAAKRKVVYKLYMNSTASNGSQGPLEPAPSTIERLCSAPRMLKESTTPCAACSVLVALTCMSRSWVVGKRSYRTDCRDSGVAVVGQWSPWRRSH